MRKLYLILLVFSTLSLSAQGVRTAYKTGEWLKFRIHYGFLNASYATIHLKENVLDDKPVHHVLGHLFDQ